MFHKKGNCANRLYLKSVTSKQNKNWNEAAAANAKEQFQISNESKLKCGNNSKIANACISLMLIEIVRNEKPGMGTIHQLRTRKKN